MSVTLTKEVGMMGSKLTAFLARGGKFWPGRITFDTAYPIGGESLSGLAWTPSQVFTQPKSGYVFDWDKTANKLKVLRSGQSLIVEEVVTVASHVGNLKHKPFYILAIDVTAGGTTGPFNIIPTGETPITLECAVTFTSGAMTFVAADAVTSVRVTYIPLHESGPFSSSNLVVDEAVVAAAAKATLANRAAAVQYVYSDENSVRCALEPVGEAPTGTNNAVIDITNGSSATDIDSNATDEGDALKVTYIKYEAFQPWQQIGDGDLTLSTEVYGFTENHYGCLAIPGLGPGLVGETGAAANVELIWSGPSASVGAGVPILNFQLNKWESNEGTALVTFAVPIILLDPFSHGEALLECANGEDLSGIGDVEFQAWAI